MKYGWIFLAFLVARAHATPAQLKEGNRLFKNGHYEEALKKYDDALVDAPHSSVLHFNAGAAAYQKGDFTRADKEFEESSQSALAPLKVASHYNRGNTHYRQQKWDEAINSYMEALRLNPQDEDARYNLATALRAKQNPPQQQGGGQGKPEEKKSEQGKGKKNEQGKGDEKKDAAQAAQPKPGEMSKEDAERLLAAAKAGELKKSNQKFPKTDVPRPDEDW